MPNPRRLAVEPSSIQTADGSGHAASDTTPMHPATRVSRRSTLLHATSQQVLLDERDRRVLLVVLVLLLREPVPFVEADEIPDRRPMLPNRADDLVGLGLGHARVVRAGDDEER